MFCSQCGSSIDVNAKFCPSCGNAQNDLSLGLNKSPAAVSYVGFWFRVLALFIDTIFCQIASVVIVFPIAFVVGASMASSGTASVADIEAVGSLLGSALGIVINWLWFTIAESSKWQASLGKKLLGLKVTDLEGNRIGFGRANARYWSKILSGILFCIGYLMVAFSSKKQGLHDKIASTLVVKS